MKDSYQKISLRDFADGAIHFINFAVFPEKAKMLSDLSFEEPFLLEGVFLGLCIKGEAEIMINTKKYNISSDTILMLQPGQLIHVTHKTTDFLVESLYVSIDFFIELSLLTDVKSSLRVNKYPCLKISEQIRQNLLEYHSFIIKRYNRDQQYNDKIMQGLLYSMIMEYISIYSNLNIEKEECKSTKRQDEITEQFFNHLMQSGSMERNVSFYADKLCITPKYLSATVKQTTGRSVLEWIHEVFVINSKMLLKNTNKSIAEICDTLNVPNDSFFCRFFKEQTGMSPMQYRNTSRI